MRILQLVSRRQRRGAEIFAADLSTALAGRGHTVHFAGINPSSVEPLTPEHVMADDVSDSSPSVLSPRVVSDLSRYLSRLDPDVIQANGGYAMKYAALAKRWNKGRWPILYCNIGFCSDWLRKPGQRIWNGWILRHAEVTAAVSEASRTDLLDTYGLDPDRVEVIRRGVPLEAENAAAARSLLRAKLGLTADAVVLLHVGSLTQEKNHAGLLRIFERIEYPDAHLVLVGDGPLRGDLERAAATIENVHILGLRSDVSQLLAGGDLLLLPSLTEGIPGVILEAGVQSLPTVAYDVGGVGEVMQDGMTGWLISLGDESAFVQALSILLNNAARRRRMGTAARAFIESNHALPGSAERFEHLLYRVAASMCEESAGPVIKNAMPRSNS